MYFVYFMQSFFFFFEKFLFLIADENIDIDIGAICIIYLLL